MIGEPGEANVRDGGFEMKRFSGSALAVAFLLFGFFCPRAASAGTIRVDREFSDASIGRELELAYDPTSEIGIEGVLAGRLEFAPSKQDVPNLGYRRGTEWVHFQISFGPEAPSSVWLQNRYPLTDFLDVFVVDRAGAVRAFHAGDQLPLGAWSMTTERFASVAIPSDSVHVYAAIRGESGHQLRTANITVQRTDDTRAPQRASRRPNGYRFVARCAG